MGLSIKITNARCEARCAYCYEQALREAGPEHADRPLDLEAVMRQMENEWSTGKYGGEPYLHGGEALLAGHDVVEKLMRKAYELAGRTNIQTYGYLIDKRYIEIFKKYNASVGISIDGPWPLNKARPVPHMSTKEVTELVHRNILWMRSEGIPVSIICVLTKANATPDKLPRLKEWLLWLADIGVTSGRLNLAHMDQKRYGKALELTPEEAENAWRELTRFVLLEAPQQLFWQPMHDAVSSLLGLEQGTCVFGKCPYYRAEAEPVILSDGTTANCLKTAKTGHMYPRLEQPEFDYRGFGGIRYEVLPQIPQEYGGCAGCRYWRNCMGGCPSEGIDGDWRNKTRFCRAYYGLFDEAEKALKRLMPNIITTPDQPVTAFPSDGVWGMNPPAFAYMSRDFTQRPSSWRGDARIKADMSKIRPQGQGGSSNPYEHLDGTIRHLDSGPSGSPRPSLENVPKQFEHLDGTIRHLDSGPYLWTNRRTPPEVEKQTVLTRLAEVDESLAAIRAEREKRGNNQ